MSNFATDLKINAPDSAIFCIQMQFSLQLSTKSITRHSRFFIKKNNVRYELLKYHRLGQSKYESLHRGYPMGDKELENEFFERIKNMSSIGLTLSWLMRAGTREQVYKRDNKLIIASYQENR